MHGRVVYPPTYEVTIRRPEPLDTKPDKYYTHEYEGYLTHKDIEKIVKMLKKYEGYDSFEIEHE